MRKYILPLIIGVVLSGCLAPSVPVDEIELDECKQQDANSCIDIAKELQTRYDANEGDQHIAKAVYMYLRKACEIDSTKCPLDPKNFFAKNDEKLANIVWLALKDEKPEKLLNLNKSVKYINDIDDTIYHLAQACVINKDEDCKRLVNKVGNIESIGSYGISINAGVVKGSSLCRDYKHSSKASRYSVEACLLDYLYDDELYFGSNKQLSLTLAKAISGMLLSKDELDRFVGFSPRFKSVLDRHYPNKDNNGGSYFKLNADNTCLDIGETDYLYYYTRRNYTKGDTEEAKEYLRLQTQFKDDYVKEMEKLHPNKFSDGYIDCSVNMIKTLSKTRVGSYMDKIIANAIKEKFDTLLDKCIDKNDKKSCELIVSDYNKIKVISHEEARDVYTVRRDMEYFIDTYYEAMQGKSLKISSSPYSDTQKKITNVVVKKFPNQLKFPDAKKYGGLFLKTNSSNDTLWWNYNYNKDEVSRLYEIASEWVGVDFANQKLMELLNNDINTVVDEFKKAMPSNGTTDGKMRNIKDIMSKVESDYDLFGVDNNEKFEALKSQIAYDVVFYYLAPETTRLIRKEFDDKYKVKKVFLSLIEKQVQISKEKIIKYIKEQNDIKVAKERKEAAKREKERVKQEKEREEAFERCKRSPQCMAQLRAKAQELRQQSRRYYMMAPHARTNKEYKKIKEQADTACGRALTIERIGRDPGIFGSALGRAEQCL